jgi:capsular exopolysaccharide synthesis family protein
MMGESVGAKLQWKDSEVLVALHDRAGMGGEQFRKMCIRLEGLQETLGGTMRVILVTSPLMGEGKTATAANLALTLSREEARRVVLVDCDVRKPRLYSLFREPPAVGLVELLMGSARASEVVQRTETGSLDVITLPRGSDPRIDPLPVDRLRSVLQELRERYDFVVCDAPPVLPIADTAALARLADGAILVVRAGMTPRHSVTHTLQMIDKQKLIGFVLNAVSERSIQKYYYKYHAEDESNGRGDRAREKR